MKLWNQIWYRVFTRIASGIFRVGNAAYNAAHSFYVKANK